MRISRMSGTFRNKLRRLPQRVTEFGRSTIQLAITLWNVGLLGVEERLFWIMWVRYKKRSNSIELQRMREWLQLDIDMKYRRETVKFNKENGPLRTRRFYRV
jgi:hypothetical protein